MSNRLLNQINNKDATIAIIGLGNIGLPLALRFSEAGYKVIGIDKDQDKIDQLHQGESYLERISQYRISKAKSHGLKATSDFSSITQADIVILCVETPLKCIADNAQHPSDSNGKYECSSPDDAARHPGYQVEPDISCLINTIDAILPYIHSGQMISLASTTYPGTTEEEIKPRIESLGYHIGQDIFVVYSSPLANTDHTDFMNQNIPQVCGGMTADCLAVGVSLYKKITSNIISVSSTRAAEMGKLIGNIQLAVNIGLMNEMKTIANKMNIDIDEVMNTVNTNILPCYDNRILIDPCYLTWKAREYGVQTKFIQLSSELTPVETNNVSSGLPNDMVQGMMESCQNN